MCIRIVRDYNPILTVQRLNHIYQYSEVYNLNISEDKYNSLLIQIQNQDVNLDNTSIYFELYNNENHIGDITVVPITTFNQENHYELCISIFDEFSHNGFARTSIHEFVTGDYLDFQYLDAMIHNNNSNKNHLVEILFDNNFEEVNNIEKVNYSGYTCYRLTKNN